VAVRAQTQPVPQTLGERLRTFLRENSLSLFFAALFLACVVGQSFAGQSAYNAEQRQHGATPVSYFDYVASSHFGQAVLENWQSEFLQFAVFILATIWLVQKGSTESKKLEDAGPETKRQQRIGYASGDESPRFARTDDWRTWLYSNSLLIAMVAIFFASWTVQSLTGWRQFNEEQLEHGGDPITWPSYVGNAELWESTLQNWQSEFLAIGVMAVFTIYLRQRGSEQSKPVGAPHEETGSSS
jgi:hypothetical protein